LQIGLIGFLLCAVNAWAGPASIQGLVKDAKGQPIKGADVRIESVDGKQLFKTVKTDPRGRYVSQGLQLRVYRVTLLVNGVVKASITNIKTKQDQATELNLDLKRVAAVQATTEQKKGRIWFGCRLVPEATSVVVGSKLTSMGRPRPVLPSTPTLVKSYAAHRIRPQQTGPRHHGRETRQ
jgi:hypothetical protein